MGSCDTEGSRGENQAAESTVCRGKSEKSGGAGNQSNRDGCL